MTIRMYKIGRGIAAVLYCTRESAEQCVAQWLPVDTAITEVYVLSVAEHDEYQRLRAIHDDVTEKHDRIGIEVGRGRGAQTPPRSTPEAP